MTTLMRKKIRALLASFLFTTFLFASPMAAISLGDTAKSGAQTRVAYRVSSVIWEKSDEEYVLRIKGDSTPTYTMYELFEPLRIIVDIANATLDSSLAFPAGLPQSPVSVVSGKVITDKEPSIARFEIFLHHDNSYTVIRANNDILVKFPKSERQTTSRKETRQTAANEPASANAIISDLLAANEGSPVVGQQPAQLTPTSPSNSDSDNTLTEPEKPTLSATTAIDEMSINDNQPQGLTKFFKAPSPPDLTFAGYTKQRITVDFYKIDLHNVFRLFGDISNLNIVVDEAVNGSLTLALNDVPWDFALDIILNLKDLQKEERFNTIVISPKSKSFTWPERALDNIEFKSDIKVQQMDQDPGGLKINKRIEVPEYILEAKKLIHQANLIERKGDFINALPLYEEAFAKWNDNANLARKISAMCLVNLEQNAKAVHYAKLILKINPGDSDGALQAAIGLGRMKKDADAKEFFELSVSGDKPASEALVSYSSFCEERQDLACSLTHLKRHEDLYGDTLTTMISKARIYDKQGNLDQAAREYQTILLSGFELPPDLARYIKGRATLIGR